MKVLVLGAGSFGGRAAIDGLLELPGVSVLGIGRSQFPKFDPLLSINDKNFEYVALDLNRSLDCMLAKIRDFEPDEVIDFLGQGMVAESFISPEDWYVTNVASKAQLYEFFLRFDKVPRLTRISTPEVFGSCSLSSNSDLWNFRPSTPYAVSHAAIDSHIRVLGDHKNLRYQLLRFSNFYGPGQQLYRLIPKAGLCALLGKRFPLHGGGLSERAFIFRSDIAKAVVAALNYGESGGVYHFRGRGYFSILEVVELVSSSLNIPMADFVVIDDERLAKDQRYELDISLAEDKLQWSPATDLETGIKSVMNWLIQNIDSLKDIPMIYQHKK